MLDLRQVDSEFQPRESFSSIDPTPLIIAAGEIVTAVEPVENISALPMLDLMLAMADEALETGRVRTGTDLIEFSGGGQGSRPKPVLKRLGSAFLRKLFKQKYQKPQK